MPFDVERIRSSLAALHDNGILPAELTLDTMINNIIGSELATGECLDVLFSLAEIVDAASPEDMAGGALFWKSVWLQKLLAQMVIANPRVVPPVHHDLITIPERGRASAPRNSLLE
jgi:hypothetical protein